MNTLALLLTPFRFTLWGVDLTLFDVIGIAGAAGMFLMLMTRSSRNLKELGRLEPPGVRRD